MANVATRLLSLIMMLQSRSSWKASELANELKVSERTVHRYMGMLEEMGIPLYSERGRYGGFSLVRGYKLPPLVFTAEEATVLYMGANLVRNVWGQTYDDAATAVTAKLNNVLPDDLRAEVAQLQQRLAVGRLAARDYRPWESTIHTLRQCIIERRCVRLSYWGIIRQEETGRVVEPYGLAFQWGQWYLAGFCHLRQDMRTFRIDRIQQIEPLTEKFTVPSDFDAREYLQRAMQYESPYRIVVHLDACVAQSVREWDSNWLEISDHDDGSIFVQFGTTDLNWATGWVLSYGAAAKALEPPELVEQVRKAAEGTLQRYNGSSALSD
ncbi:MAG: YafY family transcriptional regulator [Anaerolineae bacterium]|nr:YafY family transcriptional regulator [Anaerolineae bacterium]